MNNPFQELKEDLAQIKAILQTISEPRDQKSKEPEDIWFNLKELCEYLPDKPTTPTVYGWVHDRIIPYHKGSKKLRFLKSEIDTWLKDGRRKTMKEIHADADNYLKGKGGKHEKL